MRLDNVIAERKSKTVYRDGGYAIKLFDEGYRKSDILNEALNHSRIEETGLKVPRISEVTKIDGKWAIVSDFIEGPTLAELMERDAEKEDEYLDRFVRLQLEVHSKRAPLLNKLKDKMNRKILETDLDPTTKYELHTRLESMPKHQKVLHGDFNPSNIIAGESGDYIIDWSHATQGNASADAARTFLLFSLQDREEYAGKYLDRFCELSKTEKKYVQSWLPITAASQSVKGRPEEREILLRWIDVVDYE